MSLPIEEKMRADWNERLLCVYCHLPSFSRAPLPREAREKAVGVPLGQARAGRRAEAYLDSTSSTVTKRNDVDTALSRAAAESR